MISKLNVASVGDVHFGHPNTPTKDIIERLDAAFPDTEETGKLDLIIFEGDEFDRQIGSSDPNLLEVMFWMHRFLTMCAKRKISVRAVKGTPSHDWDQARLFQTVIQLAGIMVDFLLVEDVRIEYHPLGFTILYVPDEWKPDTNDTYQDVCQCLRENGLEQVDIAIMHGAFDYQLPSHVRAPTHNADRYLALVKHYIFIGHIHKSVVYDRILPAGSFDRLAHGEEEAKGHFRVNINAEYGDRIVFVENRQAQTYLTIDCSALTLEEAFEKLSVAKTCRDGSYLRVLAQRDDPILVNVELLRRMYPEIVWSTKAQLSETPQANLLVDLRSSYTEIQLTAANLPQLIEQRLIQQGTPPELIQRSLQLLNQAL